jgi:tape measure domain-containing protein
VGTTINAANISIGLDVKKLQEGGGFARGEIGKISQMVRQSVSPVEQYNQKLELLEKALAKGGITSQRFAEAQAHLQRQLHQANEALDKQNAKLSGTSNQFSSLANAAKGVIPAIGIGAVVRESLKLSSTVESASAAFEVLTGSASQATQIVKQMKQLDRESPLNFLDIQQAGKTLLGYGAAADSVLPRLKQLGEIAMGDGERFKSLALAFGQVTAAGRLTGQEVLQMVNNGFNPLQEISRNTGLSMIELKKEMEAGAISVKMVEDALTSATSAGGRFFGMNERLANTSAGAYAKMVSDLQAVGVELGDKLMPLAKELAGVMRDITQSKAIDEGNTLVGTVSDGLAGVSALYRDLFHGTKEDPFFELKNFNAYLDAIGQKELALKHQKIIEEYNNEQAAKELEVQKLKNLEEFGTLEVSKEQLAEKEKSAAAAEKDLAQAKKATEEYKKQVAELTKKQELEQLGEAAAKEQENIRSGMSAMQALKIRQMEEMAQLRKNELEQAKEDQKTRLQDLEEFVKADQKAAKEKEDIRKKLEKANEDAAKKIIEDNLTPMEKFTNQLAEIHKLAQGKFLTPEQADRGMGDAARDFQKSRDNGVSATIAPALKAGSVEAYKFILNRKEDAAAAAERKQMLEIQKKQLIEQEKIAANLQPMKAIR